MLQKSQKGAKRGSKHKITNFEAKYDFQVLKIHGFGINRLLHAGNNLRILWGIDRRLP